MGTRQNYQRNQRKTDGAENPLHVLPVASNLIDYTLNLTDNTKHFPKKVRFTLVNRIQDHVLSIYEKLLAANEIYPIRSAEDKARRLTLQRDALTACKMLLFFIELYQEHGRTVLRPVQKRNGGISCQNNCRRFPSARS